jgi:hypothetical protein
MLELAIRTTPISGSIMRFVIAIPRLGESFGIPWRAANCQIAAVILAVAIVNAYSLGVAVSCRHFLAERAYYSMSGRIT